MKRTTVYDRIKLILVDAHVPYVKALIIAILLWCNGLFCYVLLCYILNILTLQNS